MKCLILAAGKGIRLRTIGDPKPLVRLLGLTLIERVILTIKRCGIEEFYVVIGYKSNVVKKFLDRFSQKTGTSINYIINEEWDKENGISALKAKGIIDEKFLLCMCDHIFDESMLKKILKNGIEDREVALCVDHRLNNPIINNVREATKVLVKDGKIKDIGKDLVRYNGYDTGLFLCSPIIFDAIEESIKRNGDTTISGAIKVLAEKGSVKAIDAGEALWIDIDDYNAYKRAEMLLLDKLSQKDTDGPISRYLNRPLSLRITRYIVNTSITPNNISLFSFFISLTAFIAFLFDKYIYLLFGGLLAQISSIIDGCDGEIARLKLQYSRFGAWLDAILDRYSDALLLFGLTMYAYDPANPFPILFTGFLAIIGSFINSYMADKYDQFMQKEFSRLEGKRPIRIGRDIRIMMIFIGTLINQVFLTLLLIAIIMNLENIRRIRILYQYQN